MRWLLLVASLGLLSGCGTVQERVTQRFAAPVPQERVVEAEGRQVFVAAQEALTRLRYQLTKTAQAQGIINAQSRLIPTERFGSSDQYQIEVRLRPLDGGATRVIVQLFELSEGQFVAGATSTPIREHGRYESFFETLDAILREQGALE
jgi:uncharacterized lipoprotein YmbA